MDNHAFKKEVIAVCLAELKVKYDALTEELASLKESASSDTKSSMGDKYETGREMIMQERSKVEDQRNLISKHVSFIGSIDENKIYDKVEFGSIVFTDTSIYFICAPLGVIKVAEQQVFAISANAPIGQAMLDKKVDEEIVFNGKTISITDIK